jgi:hypothetical protein
MFESKDNAASESKINRRKDPRSDEVQARMNEAIRKGWKKIKEDPAYAERRKKIKENQKEGWKTFKEDPIAYNEWRKKRSEIKKENWKKIKEDPAAYAKVRKNQSEGCQKGWEKYKKTDDYQRFRKTRSEKLTKDWKNRDHNGYRSISKRTEEAKKKMSEAQKIHWRKFKEANKHRKKRSSTWNEWRKEILAKRSLASRIEEKEGGN